MKFDPIELFVIVNQKAENPLLVGILIGIAASTIATSVSLSYCTISLFSLFCIGCITAGILFCIVIYWKLRRKLNWWKSGRILIIITEKLQKFEIQGYEAIKKRVRIGNKSSGRLNMPLSWESCDVMVIRLTPIIEKRNNKSQEA